MASHYKDSLSEKIELLRCSIRETRQVTFLYYSPKGKGIRKVEPYKVLYQHGAWYVIGYCLMRKAFRRFKLNRLWYLKEEEETFQKKEIPQSTWTMDEYFEKEYYFEALFPKNLEYLLVETYGPHCYQETEEGMLKLSGVYADLNFITRWLLGFGNQIQVLSPPELVKHLKKSVMTFP